MGAPNDIDFQRNAERYGLNPADFGYFQHIGPQTQLQFPKGCHPNYIETDTTIHFTRRDMNPLALFHPAPGGDTNTIARFTPPPPPPPGREWNMFEIADLNFDNYYTHDIKPRYFPMPTIDNRNVKHLKGPINGVDENYRREWEAKQAKVKRRQRKDWQNKMIDLLNRRENWKYKLSKLQPIRRNEREIAVLNIKISDADRDIKHLETLVGIKLEELEEGSKVKRFIDRAQITVTKTVKKVKKFFKKHKETIVTCLAVAIPTVLRWCTRLLFGG